MKVVLILHNIYKSLGIEWLTKGLLKNNCKLYFILINDDASEMEDFLHQLNVPVIRLSYTTKTEAPVLLYKICSQLIKIKPDVVHTHLRTADLFGQIAAYLCRIKKRVYTRHSSTFNHLYHKRSVVLDKLTNFLATDIIAISEVTSKVLIEMEHVAPSKVALIHHGFDLAGFECVEPQRIIALKNKYALRNDQKIIGVFARYTHWKGYQYIIPALARLKKAFQDTHFIFANTTGEYGTEIKKLLTDNLTPDSYTEIRFENDIQAFYKLLDVYVHTPIDDKIEAFGQTYVEALAAGIPSVFTLSGVANEFVIDQENALVVDYKNSEQIYDAIVRLLNNEALQKQLIINGKRAVQQFNLDTFISKTIHLYNN